MRSDLRVIWWDGFLALYDGVVRISAEYEVPEEDYHKSCRMIKALVKQSYDLGAAVKAREIREALGVSND